MQYTRIRRREIEKYLVKLCLCVLEVNIRKYYGKKLKDNYWNTSELKRREIYFSKIKKETDTKSIT